MEDSKIWISVIIGAFYLIGWVVRKMGSKPEDTPDTDQPMQRRQMDERPKQPTFEELLREITEGKTVRQQPLPAPKPTYVDYDDDLEEEAKSLEQIPNNYQKKDNIYEIYEEAKKAAFNRPSLEETMKLADTDVKFGRFEVFEQEEQKNVLDEYTRNFQDPEGFKRAFVMSEILKTKF